MGETGEGPDVCRCVVHPHEYAQASAPESWARRAGDLALLVLKFAPRGYNARDRNGLRRSCHAHPSDSSAACKRLQRLTRAPRSRHREVVCAPTVYPSPSRLLRKADAPEIGCDRIPNTVWRGAIAARTLAMKFGICHLNRQSPRGPLRLVVCHQQWPWLMRRPPSGGSIAEPCGGYNRVGSGSQLSELALLLVEPSQRQFVNDRRDIGHATSARPATVAARSRSSKRADVDGLSAPFGESLGTLTGATTVACTTTGALQPKSKATTGIEPVWTALQRARSRSYELLAGVFGSVRCSEFS
jgi:hypothetical protein